MHRQPGPAWAAFAFLLFAASPAAAEPAAPQLQAEIDDFLGRLDAATHGLVKWEGAEHTDMRRDGDAAVADFANARVSIGDEDAPKEKRAQVTFDHIEIRRTPAVDGGHKLSFVLPKQVAINAPDRGETLLALKDATGSVVIDGQSGRVNASEFAIAGARLDDKATGDWVSFGPFSASSRIVAGADGGWTGPVKVDLKTVEFLDTHGPVGGTIDRIAYDARTGGPDLVALNRLRDRIEGLRKQDLPAAARREATLALLPDLWSMFSEARGELRVEGLTVRAAAGQPLVALKKASAGGVLTGMSGNSAAWRVTIRHDGLSLAPSVLDPGKVPQKGLLDIAIEDVDTGVLRSLIDAAAKLRGDADDADKQKARQQALGAAAKLYPTLRLYDLSLDTPDAGVAAKGEAKGSPLSPKGYDAGFDIAVRGFDALGGLIGAGAGETYLPLLKEIGAPGKADDGTPRLQFHLASTPQKPITLNGNEIIAWFGGGKSAPGMPRDLRPAEPAMHGADVAAVQAALADAHIKAPQNGSYDGATAAAVARFQKANGLDSNGVVDAVTRQKLGVKPAAEKGAN